MPFGKIEPFDVGSHNWDAYCRRVKQFIALNNISKELHVATLVTHVGITCYELMCDLCSPELPENKTFEQLVKIVKDHLEPQRSEIAERHMFRQRKQLQGEAVSDYLKSLKHLAKHCNFRDSLEVNLRDQFVSGLHSEDMRSRLFAERNIDYKRAVELALALEAAERHAAEAASGASAAVVPEALHCIRPSTARGERGRTERQGGGQGGSQEDGAGSAGAGSSRRGCWRCGRGHPPSRCRFKSYTCDTCGSRGHLKAVCRNSDKCSDKCSDSTNQKNPKDKGENIWDRLTHTNPDFIKDRSNGDIAADTYTNYKTDVQMMRELGLDLYRFSLSWTRILPNGISNKISKDGVAFYNNYINEMLKYNITPMVTLYHWDLPQKLQELGGFLNPNLHEWFEDYARIAYDNFGDRVKHWITFNEPREICYEGYGSDTKAPAVNATDIGTYHCAKNLIIAHAKAYHAYVNDFKPKQGGVCGITLNVNWFGPLTESEDDLLATKIRRQAEWGLYAEPIFSEHGGFPPELCEIVANKSADQGYRRSRMPEFTDEERNLVRGSADFFGLNHYTGILVSATKFKEHHPVPSLLDDVDVGLYTPPEWLKSASAWLTLSPKSLYNVLTHLHKKYNGPIFYVTENGWSETPLDGYYNDNGRVKYYRAKLNDALDALEAGVDLRGYMAWSLMDNFEWHQGYLERFGLYDVNFKSEFRERRPRKSAFVYKQIIKTRVVDPDYEPDSLTMRIDDGQYSSPIYYNPFFTGPISVHYQLLRFAVI